VVVFGLNWRPPLPTVIVAVAPDADAVDDDDVDDVVAAAPLAVVVGDG